MGVELVAEETITVGEPATVAGPSPRSTFAIYFEDDGDTGYLYGLDFSREGNPILDAMLIYNVDQVTDRDKPSSVQLIWSTDGLKAALLINEYPHAIFDFDARRGYCRSGFPPADPKWTEFDHSWDDAAVELFR
ncbi:MAG: DUF2251 domain-containing protein [Isosphaeraceae bacterium]|nr:DUF2251 domain-containing protein [Isosphaeraceae bacterium]